MTAGTQVVVGIITRRRLDGLGRLLDGIALQKLNGVGHEIRVVVVDNDPDASSQTLVEERASDFRFRLDWVHEPRIGIPFARNEVVRRADEAEFIAFIDDDEWPEAGWLGELLRVQGNFDADLVAGPVLSEFEEPPPEWVVRGGFFERPRRSTGSPIQTAGTGNILFRRRTLSRVEGPFNEAMATTGGSDAYLTHALHQLNARMVWADDAVVTETVPASRVSMQWLLRRSYRSGLMRAYTEHDRADSSLVSLRIVAKGELMVAAGLLSAPFALPMAKHRLVKSLRRSLYGAGLVAGVFGQRYEEYRDVHGR